MNRFVATGFALLASVAPVIHGAQEPSAGTSAQAGALARAELARRFGGSAEAFKILRIEPAQWRDSSLGCARAGSQYMQVISTGHAVFLERDGQQHEVHVSGRNAVICDASPQGTLRLPTRAQGLQDASARARNDLAAKLGLQVDRVRVERMEPQRWQDSSLGCPSVAGQPLQQAVSGYKLHLSAAGRLYTYHTDLKNVFACPPIESE